MEIKLLSKEEDKVIFSVKGIDETIANALRRSMQEVPVLAVDEVEFIKNDSALSDEILAHRVGLLPLHTEKGLISRQNCICKGKGCSKCTVALKLKAKGPCIVYSSELKGKNLIIYKKMPIVELAKEQELELNAYARMGTAKEHAKFSPGLFYFKPSAQIKFSKECDLCESCTKACPLHILSIDSKEISVKKIEECNLCEACLEACKKHGKDSVSIEPSKEEFIFTIESWGQISPKEIFIKICNVVEKNLKETDKEASKI